MMAFVRGVIFFSISAGSMEKKPGSMSTKTTRAPVSVMASAVGMAMAARYTVALVDEIVEPGELDPECVVTPHVFVEAIVKESAS